MDRYELRIVGELGERRRRDLGCEPGRTATDGLSRLVTPPLDQAALYGLLSRLRDAGVELIAIERLRSPGPHPSPVVVDKPAAD